MRNLLTDLVKEKHLSYDIMRMKEEMEMYEKVSNDIIEFLHQRLDIRNCGVYNLDLLMDYYKVCNDWFQEQIILNINDFGLRYFDLYHEFQQEIINAFVEQLESLDEDYIPTLDEIGQLEEDEWLDEQWENEVEDEMDLD